MFETPPFQIGPNLVIPPIHIWKMVAILAVWFFMGKWLILRWLNNKPILDKNGSEVYSTHTGLINDDGKTSATLTRVERKSICLYWEDETGNIHIERYACGKELRKSPWSVETWLERVDRKAEERRKLCTCHPLATEHHDKCPCYDPVVFKNRIFMKKMRERFRDKYKA